MKHIGEAGISFSKDDLMIPTETRRDRLVRLTRDVCFVLSNSNSMDGLITQGEKYNKVIDEWDRCADAVAKRCHDGRYVINEAN